MPTREWTIEEDVVLLNLLRKKDIGYAAKKLLRTDTAVAARIGFLDRNPIVAGRDGKLTYRPKKYKTGSLGDPIDVFSALHHKAMTETTFELKI